jgi:hypothetical protein
MTEQNIFVMECHYQRRQLMPDETNTIEIEIKDGSNSVPTLMHCTNTMNSRIYALNSAPTSELDEKSNLDEVMNMNLKISGDPEKKINLDHQFDFDYKLQTIPNKLLKIKSKHLKELIDSIDTEIEEKRRYINIVATDIKGDVIIQYEEEFLNCALDYRADTIEEKRKIRLAYRNQESQKLNKSKSTKAFLDKRKFYDDLKRISGDNISGDNIFSEYLDRIIEYCELFGSYENSDLKFTTDYLNFLKIKELYSFLRSLKVKYKLLTESHPLWSTRGYLRSTRGYLRSTRGYLRSTNEFHTFLSDITDEQWLQITFDDFPVPFIHELIIFAIDEIKKNDNTTYLMDIFKIIPVYVWMCPWLVDKDSNNPIQLLALMIGHMHVSDDTKKKAQVCINLFGFVFKQKNKPIQLVRHRILDVKTIEDYVQLTKTTLKVPLKHFFMRASIDGRKYLVM